VSFKNAIKIDPKTDLPKDLGPGIEQLWAKATGKAPPPAGGTALPMMRLRAAVPPPRDAPQPGEPEPEEHERAGFRDANAGHS